MFVTQRVGRRIIAKSPVAPLARGFAKQKAIVHACAQRGLNAATQKVSSSIKTLLQEAGDAIKTRSLEPAFAGIDRVERAAEQTASQSKSLQPRRSERLMKKAEGVNKQLEKKGTVWDCVKMTGDIEQRTMIPRSFEISLKSHRLWVHPNATEHMVEYIRSRPVTHGMPMNSQALLESFKQALEKCVANGIEYTEVPIKIDSWEFMFGKPRGDGLLPVVKHALYKP